ncbi:MAG: hypothetical protein HOP19_26985 [Acidobacteria bacterium]|nr:hypothetical protein [Acidobacteriota bacterium]
MRAFSTVVCLFVLALSAHAQTGATAQNPTTPESLSSTYYQTDVAELLQRATALEGRRVTLTAEVVSLNARRQTIELFDEASHKFIVVSIANLSRSQRKVLLNEPVNRVTVYGKVVRNNPWGNGQMLLEAEQLMPVVITLAKTLR